MARPETSILNDIELDAVVGGSFWSAVAAGAIQGAMGGAGGATGGGTTLPPSNFGPATGTGGGGRCNTNHRASIIETAQRHSRPPQLAVSFIAGQDYLTIVGVVLAVAAGSGLRRRSSGGCRRGAGKLRDHSMLKDRGGVRDEAIMT